jgi:hypothetical protein
VARLRFDNIFGTATGNPITCPSGAGTATLTSPPGLPAITGADFVAIIIEPGTANEDIRYAQYSGSGTSLTVGAAQEGTTGISHAAVAWAHGPTAADFTSGPSFPIHSGSGSPQGVVSGSLGDSYLDTTNGGIYWENNQDSFNSGPPNDWVFGAGATSGIAAGSPVPGGWIMDVSDQFLYTLADGEGGTAGWALSDTGAIAGGGSFNGLFYGTSGTDGSQTVTLRLGTAGAFSWNFDNLGRLTMPGLLVLDTLQAGNGYVINTGAYAMTGKELIVQGNGAITLPDPVANGFNMYWIKDSGSGTLTLHRHGTEHIDGATGPIAFAAYEAVLLISDFTNWNVISANAGAIV